MRPGNLVDRWKVVLVVKEQVTHIISRFEIQCLKAFCPSPLDLAPPSHLQCQFRIVATWREFGQDFRYPRAGVSNGIRYARCGNAAAPK